MYIYIYIYIYTHMLNLPPVALPGGPAAAGRAASRAWS